MILDGDLAAPIQAVVRQNPVNAALIERLPALNLPDCWLVAGCIFGTVWNVRSGRPPTENIRDYDVFYFDAADLSFEAEDAVIRRVDAAFADLCATVEVRNQARVHLWYERRFGRPYAPLASSTDGIDRFLVACTCIGVRCTAGRTPDVYATHGLDDLISGVLSPNPCNHAADLFFEKAESYQKRWSWLRMA